MRFQYYTATSIDGFIADADNSLEWLFQFGDEPEQGGGDQPSRYQRFLAGVGAIVMGATTYEWLLEHEIGDDPGRWPYAQPTWVFTHRELPVLTGRDIRFVRGDVARVLPDIRAAAGEHNVWIVGGGDLVGQFHEAGALHDLFLGVAPVILGAGAPLLPRKLASPPLELVEAVVEGPFVSSHYRVR